MRHLPKYRSILYYTHQHIELPEIVMRVTHFILRKGTCATCGKIGRGYVPGEFRTGFGARFTHWRPNSAGLTAAAGRLSGNLSAPFPVFISVPVQRRKSSTGLRRLPNRITGPYGMPQQAETSGMQTKRPEKQAENLTGYGLWRTGVPLFS